MKKQLLVGLHDAEREYKPNKTFPNLAIMKLSAFFKKCGESVEWFDESLSTHYDVVYSSKVFTFTPENPSLPANTVKGGTGYGLYDELPAEIDRCFPDYSIYPECDYAIGFLTRGCPNKCAWCVVPQKEGGIRSYCKWQDIVRHDTDKLLLLDNNILASNFGINQLAELTRTNYKIDLNQGMDARLVTPHIADILSNLKWIKYLRFSCDQINQIEAIENAASLLAQRGIKPWRLFIYLLVTKDIPNAAYRVERLNRLGNITIYAQAERQKNIYPNKLQKIFTQKYVYKQLFRKETWLDYCNRHNLSALEAEGGDVR